MTMETSTEEPTREPCMEPPMKKQKVVGGGAVATATSANDELSSEYVQKTVGRPGKRKRSRSKNKFRAPCNEMPLFKAQEYMTILKIYLQKIKGMKNPFLIFETAEDPALKIPGCTFFVSTCKIGGLIGKGRGRTKKKAKQKACLHIIQKEGLVPKKAMVDTMDVTLPPPEKKGAGKPPTPIIEYKSYLQGNFKGALDRYLKKNDLGNSVILESDIVRNGNEQEFVTTCATVKGIHKGCGNHKVKKKSIQLAYLSCMLDMKLISKEEHLEKLPQALMKEKVAAKSQGSSEKEEDGEQSNALIDKAMETEDFVSEKQKVDEPSKKVKEEIEDHQAQYTSAAKEEKVMNEKQTEIGASKMEEETETPT